MQETPNYSSYLSRFQNINLQGLLDGREKIDGSDEKFLISVYDRLALYFEHDEFRIQIPLQRKQYVEDNFITNILSYVETIFSWQQDGVTQINGPNLQNQITNLSDQITTLDAQISGFYFTYLSSVEPLGQRVQEITALKSAAENEGETLKNIVQNVTEQVNTSKASFDEKIETISVKAQKNLNDKINRAENTLDGISKILNDAKLLAGIGGGHKLANYYQKLSNGRSTDGNDSFTAKQGTKTNKLINSIKFSRLAIGLGLSSIISYPIVVYLLTNEIKIDIWGTALILIISYATLLFSIIYLSIGILKAFNNRYKGGHERLSALWMIGGVLTTILTAVYSAILVHDLSSSGKITWEEIIPKIIVLLAPAYLVRLCVQNYRANAHLQVQYMHRATIVSIAETYSEATSLKDPRDQDNEELRLATAQAKMQILTEAARVMFAQSESGFITQKEGAGSNGDNPMDSVQNIIKLK